jgi:hypothetical protein
MYNPRLKLPWVRCEIIELCIFRSSDIYMELYLGIRQVFGEMMVLSIGNVTPVACEKVVGLKSALRN